MSRHFGTSNYCVACRLRCEVCVCAEAPRLTLGTRVVLVIHSSEWGRVGNTGHLVRLAVREADVRLHGRRHRAVDPAGIDAGAASTLVLFPGRGAVSLTKEYLEALPRPITLLVPDGNWTQTKHMMARVPMLRQGNPVRLEGPSLELPCVRRNNDTDRRSTFEAIAKTLGLLEGPDVERRMIGFFRRVLASKPEYGVKRARA